MQKYFSALRVRPFWVHIGAWNDDNMGDGDYSFSGGTVFMRQILTSLCRRQILTYKDDPRTERIEIELFVMELKYL